MEKDLHGLLWYTPKTYEWCTQNMEDGATFWTYSEWLQLAQQSEQDLKRNGKAFVRVNFDPGLFIEWRAMSGGKANADGRMQFAAWRAAQQDAN